MAKTVVGKGAVMSGALARRMNHFACNKMKCGGELVSNNRRQKYIGMLLYLLRITLEILIERSRCARSSVIFEP